MRTMRLRLRFWAMAWLVFQAVALATLVPRDCCASHRPASAREPACHGEAVASHCSEPASGDTTCRRHRSESRDTCVLRGTCDGPLAALAVLLPYNGIPAERVAYNPALTLLGPFDSTNETPLGHPAPPDIPPPRA